MDNKINQQTWAERVANLVRVPLPHAEGIHDENSAAKKLHISARSLRRYLKQEGVAFSQIKGDYLKGRSLKLLADPNIALSIIAGRLGYANQPAFTRAFRRWYKMSPLKYRQIHFPEPAKNDSLEHNESGFWDDYWRQQEVEDEWPTG